MSNSEPEAREPLSLSSKEITPLMKELGGVFAWTSDDDKRLSSIMSKHKASSRKIWDSVAREFGNGKSEKECCQRWNWYLSPQKKNAHKRRFTVEEDAIITSQVLNYEGGKKKPCWISIAKQVDSEGNRVRERWSNILNPKINHLPFSKEEDVRLYEGLREHGQKWTSIAKEFFRFTRSDTQLKNRFKTVTFKQFHARVSARVLLETKEKGNNREQHACADSNIFMNESSLSSGERKFSNTTDLVTAPVSASTSVQACNDFDERSSVLAKRLKVSVAAKVLQEDIPRPSPGKCFSPLEASQILSKIGSSERRTVMKQWIDQKYVPVNLTSLYRALDRYKRGKKLKSKWYCEGKGSERKDNGVAGTTKGQ